MKEIAGFPGYLVDVDGIIWTTKRKGGNERAAGQRGTPKPLKPHRTRSGYLVVSLDRAGVVYTRLVHRLVLETFVGLRPDGMQGCHYPDSDKSNNRLDNLRWDTRGENAKDAYRDRPGDAPKRCRRCGTVKPPIEFYRDSRASDGLHTECKPCHSAIAQATRDPEKRRKANREWMRRHRMAKR